MSKNHERTKKDDAPEALIPSSANILVTGGAGFIGSNFIRHVLGRTDFNGTVVNYDKLTYAVPATTDGTRSTATRSKKISAGSRNTPLQTA